MSDQSETKELQSRFMLSLPLVLYDWLIHSARLHELELLSIDTVHRLQELMGDESAT